MPRRSTATASQTHTFRDDSDAERVRSASVHRTGPDPDPERLGQARSLRARATSLRHQASSLPTILADSYRRRAAELELEAWIAEVQSGIPYDEVHPAA